jgi:hypothetical protein
LDIGFKLVLLVGHEVNEKRKLWCGEGVQVEWRTEGHIPEQRAPKWRLTRAERDRSLSWQMAAVRRSCV